MTSTDATRKNHRDHGAPIRGVYFGRNPRRPASDGLIVTFRRHGRGISVFDEKAQVVESFGDTAAFWMSPAPELHAPKMTCHRDGCSEDLAKHYSSDRLPNGCCDTDDGRATNQIAAWYARHDLTDVHTFTAERILAARDTDWDEALTAHQGQAARPIAIRDPEVSGAWASADEDGQEQQLLQAHAQAIAEDRSRTTR